MSDHLSTANHAAAMGILQSYIASHGGMHGWLWPLSEPAFFWIGTGISALYALASLAEWIATRFFSEA